MATHALKNGLFAWTCLIKFMLGCSVNIGCLFSGFCSVFIRQLAGFLGSTSLLDIVVEGKGRLVDIN